MQFRLQTPGAVDVDKVRAELFPTAVGQPVVAPLPTDHLAADLSNERGQWVQNATTSTSPGSRSAFRSTRPWWVSNFSSRDVS